LWLLIQFFFHERTKPNICAQCQKCHSSGGGKTTIEAGIQNGTASGKGEVHGEKCELSGENEGGREEKPEGKSSSAECLILVMAGSIRLGLGAKNCRVSWLSDSKQKCNWAWVFPGFSPSFPHTQSLRPPFLA